MRVKHEVRQRVELLAYLAVVFLSSLAFGLAHCAPAHWSHP